MTWQRKKGRVVGRICIDLFIVERPEARSDNKKGVIRYNTGVGFLASFP